MPKIAAPTVAEHRAAQRRALVAAAEAIIIEHGVAVVSPRSVGERAGLARSSVYEYFPSGDDLIAAVAVEAFERWSDELRAATAGATPGRERLHIYITETLRMTADGKHSLATDLQQADIAPKEHGRCSSPESSSSACSTRSATR